MDRVFVDTNCARGESSLTYLLGNRAELKKFSERVALYFPSMVIDELIEQKRRRYIVEIEELKSNGALQYHKPGLIDFDEEAFAPIEEKLRADRSIPFEIIDIDDNAKAFETAWNLALKNDAPFEPKTDKGFKDFCIAYAVSEFVKSRSVNGSDYILSRDKRFTEFFLSTNKNIVPIQSYEEYCSLVFGDDNGGTKAHERELSIEGAPALATPIDVERISPTEIREAIRDLRESRSFSKTHSVIDRLKLYEEGLTESDEIEILRIAGSNDQVYRILNDEDVRLFLFPIFSKYGPRLSPDEYRTINEYSGWGQLQTYEDETDLSEDGKMAYRAFAREIKDHLFGIVLGASVQTDVKALEDSLNKVYRSTKLMTEMPTCGPLLNLFIDGGYRFEARGFKISALREFIMLLATSTDEQLETISLNLSMLFASVDRYVNGDPDIPF